MRDDHVPGPTARVSGLVVTALTVTTFLYGLVSGVLPWYLILFGVIAGFTAADLVDALRQQAYWPTYPSIAPVVEPTPNGPRVSGVAAEHAVRLARRAALLPTASHLGAPPMWARVAAVVYVGASLTGFRGSLWAMSAAAVVAGAVIRLATPFAYRSQRRIAAIRSHSASRAAARMRGAAAERSVGNALNSDERLEFVLHAKMIGKGDCDHIVVGPSFAAIETKSGGGPIRFSDGQLLTGTKCFSTDLLADIQAKAALVSKVGRSPAAPVLCVDDASGGPIQIGGVWVCGQDGLTDLLVELAGDCPLDPGDAKHIYNRLIRHHRKSMRRRAQRSADLVGPRTWKLLSSTDKHERR